MEPAPTRDHRLGRENGNIVYPVVSRRSRGLSVGINLFTKRKACDFDCPYCEVFPFASNEDFSLDRLSKDLLSCLGSARFPIMDICFSGNGEPTLSPEFPAALDVALAARDAAGMAEVPVVVITNGTSYRRPVAFAALVEAANRSNAIPWVKLDAGSVRWYEKISRSRVPFDELRSGIARYFSRAPGILQTMLCSIGGDLPDDEETLAWLDAVASILDSGGQISEIHLYTQSRPAPEGITGPVDSRFLLHRAALARQRFPGLIVKTFGQE